MPSTAPLLDVEARGDGDGEGAAATGEGRCLCRHRLLQVIGGASLAGASLACAPLILASPDALALHGDAPAEAPHVSLAGLGLLESLELDVLDVLLGVLITCAVLLMLQWLLHRLIVCIIRRVDWEKHLGVALSLDDFRFNLCKGRISIVGCRVHNPPGFREPDLLTVGDFFVDVNVCQILSSRFKNIEVESLEMSGIRVDVEKPGGIIFGESNVHAIMENIDKVSKFKSETMAAETPKEIEPVYEFWHAKNACHSYHFIPAWGGEERRSATFYAHRHEVPGSKAVHAFWHWASGSRRYHVGKAQVGEKKDSYHFYAFTEKVPGTEPVYSYWFVADGHKKKQRLHMGDRKAEPGETLAELVFYAYAKDPTGQAKAKQDAKPELRPVRSFFNVGTRNHTFHFQPSWRGETQGQVVFEAYNLPTHSTEPVYSYWHKWRREFTFHCGDPWEGETQKGVQFHAFTQQKRNTLPVYAFWHARRKEHMFHMGGPNRGETQLDVVFYAYPHERKKSAPPSILLRKVSLQGITMRASARFKGFNVRMDDIHYEDFCEETGAYRPEEVAKRLLKDIIFNIHFRLGSGESNGREHCLPCRQS